MRKRLTKKQAIKECKELWEEIDKSGLSKYAFLDYLVAPVWFEKEEVQNENRGTG